MILTCPQCQAQYALAPEKLGAGGRTVRCVGCSHTWFQKPETSDEPANIEDIFKDIQNVIHEQQAQPEAEELRQHHETQAPAESSEIFDEIMSKVDSKKKREVSAAVVTHNPLGVEARTFGILTFLLCLSVTLLVLFAAQKPIIRHFPQMTLLYKSIGIHPKVPGADLRLSEMEAEEKIENQKRLLVIAGKITNMSEDEMSAPPLRVILKDKDSTTLKEWDIPAAKAVIASGATVPVKLQLKDTPADGVNAEIRIQDK